MLTDFIGLLQEQKISPEELQKQLLRHQTPLGMQVIALIKLLEYQKSLIPKHLIKPLATCFKNYINNELDKFIQSCE